MVFSRTAVDLSDQAHLQDLSHEVLGFVGRCATVGLVTYTSMVERHSITRFRLLLSIKTGIAVADWGRHRQGSIHVSFGSQAVWSYWFHHRRWWGWIQDCGRHSTSTNDQARIHRLVEGRWWGDRRQRQQIQGQARRTLCEAFGRWLGAQDIPSHCLANCIELKLILNPRLYTRLARSLKYPCDSLIPIASSDYLYKSSRWTMWG